LLAAAKSSAGGPPMKTAASNGRFSRRAFSLNREMLLGTSAAQPMPILALISAIDAEIVRAVSDRASPRRRRG